MSNVFLFRCVSVLLCTIARLAGAQQLVRPKQSPLVPSTAMSAPLPIRLLPQAIQQSPEQPTIHLLPFHLHFDGPASISSNFVRRAVPDSSEAEEASFRGRQLYSLPLHVPQGYQGVILNVKQPPALPSIASPRAPEPSRKRKIVTKQVTAPVKARRMSPRKAVQRVRERQQFSMDSPSPEGSPEPEFKVDIPMIVIEAATQEDGVDGATEIVQEKVVEQVIKEEMKVEIEPQVTEHKPVEMDSQQEQEEEPQEALPKATVDLKPISTFSSFSIWNPDAPLGKLASHSASCKAYPA